MSSTAIKVENLSKRYRIGLKEELHDTLAGAITSWVKSPLSNFRRLRRLSRFDENTDEEDVIWALKDISFEVKEGEVVGIIGKNGAGKSTLLKILSRIAEPTSGRAQIRGRLSSLLEVGTGFHPELTGRENIYLNSAILGMRKATIQRKFDEIVDFAEVERFIDTPVKRYSTGMRVRLAFSVAAHLEPQILLVDEVLAVGDDAFQKKCLGKMGDVARQGRTVLFVSHNMGAVRNLCSRGIWLREGTITLDGDADSVVNAYLESTLSRADEGCVLLEDRVDRKGDGKVRFTSFCACVAGGGLSDLPRTGHDMELILGYRSGTRDRITTLTVDVSIMNMQGNSLACVGNRYVGMPLTNLPPEGKLVCLIPSLPLQPGYYYASFSCNANGVNSDKIRDAVKIHVLEGDFFGTYVLPPKKHGDILLSHKWSFQQSDNAVEAVEKNQAHCAKAADYPS